MNGVYVFTIFVSDVAIEFENMVNDVFGEMFHNVYNWLLLICLFVYLFICLFVYLFICLFVYLFICLFVYLFVSLHTI
jgi:hypothetical protein